MSSARRNAGGPVGGPGEAALRLANWLRDSKQSGLTTREAVQYEKRVDYFKGTRLLEVLQSDKYKALKGVPAVKSKTDAIAVANMLMRNQFFHRSQRIFISAKRWELEVHQGSFDEEGLYTWIHEGSKTRLYVLCGLTLLGSLLLCMVQIWPIWMKIGLWWCSVTFLTTFSALCVLRWMLFCVMFAVGFRGIWLFPNLFDDNQTFAGSFMPIMGRATPIVVAEDDDSDDDDLRSIKRKPKKEKSEDGTPAKAAAKAADDEPAYRFGLINAAILGGIGLVVCWNIGLLDGDNVPDFVAKHDDLQYYFPSIAPPENTTASGEAAGEAERDPFAAPDLEDE